MNYRIVLVLLVFLNFVGFAQAQTVTWLTGTYVYDGARNIKSIGTTEQYRYDGLSRLVSGTVAAGRTQSATYDTYGNIRALTTDATAMTFGVNPSTNRVTYPTDPVTGLSYNIFGTYDEAGRLLTSSGGVGNTFDYDAGDMVTKSTVEGTTKVHLYTANDERVASVTFLGSAETGSEWTLRAPSGKVLRRVEKTGSQWTWKEDYVYSGAQLLASEVNTPAQVLHYFTDHLGSPRLITANGGTKVALHTYFPYGEEATLPSQDNEKLKFTGHERDAASLDYMHARYYGPKWGRFLSVDPSPRQRLQQPRSWNRYAYSFNNPLKYVDPDGRDAVVFIVSSGKNWDEKGGHAAVWVESGNRRGGVSRGGYNIDKNGWKDFLAHYAGQGREVHAYILKTTDAQDQAMLDFIKQEGPAAGTDVDQSIQTCGLTENCASGVVNVLQAGGVVPANSDPSAARGANSPFVLKNELDNGQLKPQVQRHIDFVPPPPPKKESWWSRVIDRIF